MPEEKALRGPGGESEDASLASPPDEKMRAMESGSPVAPAPIELLDRRLYSMVQVDRLLGVNAGTARRWIDGYKRAGRLYPPVVRIEATGDPLVTWGEFVETRLLAEYRDATVPLVRMRPAIERLREELQTRYPLAHARPFVSGRELVLKVQEAVALVSPLQLVVIRSGQLVLAPAAERFWSAVEFGPDEGPVERVHPAPDLRRVVIDPLRQFGEPVIRSVRTEVIAEQIRAGDPIEMIAKLYELSREEVEEALRYELIRSEAAA
jgi:uncharacterized protein (DUF433 family)